MNIFEKLLNKVTGNYKPDQKTLFIYPGKTAGQRVDYDTALTYSAVWRAVSLISESIACLPWRVMSRDTRPGDGRTITTTLDRHPAASILDILPNSETDAFQFRQTIISHALTWGNGYAEIERDRSNRPIALWILQPSRVTVERDETGSLIYKVKNGSMAESIIEKENIFHLKGMGFDGLVGYSVINHAARSIGLGLATERFGADFFSNGAHAGGVLEHPKGLSDVAHNRLKESLLEATGAGKSSAPLILEEGMKWESISVPPDDAQFLETRKFNVAEVARWFGVPLHKLHEMEKSSFNNIEQQNIEFVSDALLSWVKRLELEANIKLISPGMRGRIYTKLNMNGLLRGDTAARGEWYTRMHTMGVYSVNDIRELEDQNPIGSEGDKHLVQLNLTTLEKVGDNENSNQNTTPQMDEQPGAPGAETAQDKLLSDVFNKINRRATSRINERLSKKQTESDLKNWIDEFKDNHAQYIQHKVEPLLNAFGHKIELSEIIGQYLDTLHDGVLNSYQAQQSYSDDIEQFTTQLLVKL